MLEPNTGCGALYQKDEVEGVENGSLANDLCSALQASAMKSFGKKKSRKLTTAVYNIATCKGIAKEKRECWKLSCECAQGERSPNLS